MKQLNLVLFLTFSVLLVGHSALLADYEWEPVNSWEWEVREAEGQAKGAIMIFEKVIADDEDLVDGRIYHHLYRRIRILSPEGHDWADVDVPYLNRKQKVEKIYARAIQRDGTITELHKDEIIEKEVFKSKKYKIKQKSFSIPGVSDDCIIEYYIKFRSPTPRSSWVYQKSIAVMKAELVWKFFAGQGISGVAYSSVADEITPNYTWVNADNNGQINVEQRPSVKNPKEVVFTVGEIAPFEEEPYSQPEIALKAQLRIYYGKSAGVASYWGDESKNRSERLREYTKKNKRLRKVVERWVNLPSDEEKIKAAYTWIKANLENTAYADDDKKYKKNNHVDDVLKRGYGTSWSINVVFYDMLREMNIDAKLTYAIDRDDNFLAYQAKYWQFDRSMVGVPVAASKDYDFLYPAIRYLPYKHIPWYNEGSPAFIVGDQLDQFAVIPYSMPQANQLKRFQWLTMDEDLMFSGKMAEQHNGHFARTLRLELNGETQTERINYLTEEFKERFPQGEIDSIVIKNMEDYNKKLTVQCQISIEPSSQLAGNRLLIKPSELFSQRDNPFTADERNHLVMFDFAKEELDVLDLRLGGDWKIEAVPNDTSFANQVGRCEIRFMPQQGGKALSVQRLFTLNTPLFRATDYADIRKLFETQLEFQEMTVVLTEDLTE